MNFSYHEIDKSFEKNDNESYVYKSTFKRDVTIPNDINSIKDLYLKIYNEKSQNSFGERRIVDGKV